MQRLNSQNSLVFFPVSGELVGEKSSHVTASTASQSWYFFLFLQFQHKLQICGLVDKTCKGPLSFGSAQVVKNRDGPQYFFSLNREVHFGDSLPKSNSLFDPTPRSLSDREIDGQSAHTRAITVAPKRRAEPSVSLWTKCSSIGLGSGRKRFRLAAEGGVIESLWM